MISKTNSVENYEEKMKCICHKNTKMDENNLGKYKTRKCTTCNFHQHEQCVKDLMIKNYQCPGCQIKDMDPYIKRLYNILPASLLKYENKEVKCQFHFLITSEIVKIMESNSGKKNDVFYMIRSLRLDEEGYEQHWPLNFAISINGMQLKSLTLPKFPPRSKSRVDHPMVFYNKVEDLNQNNNYHNMNKEYYFFAGKYLNLNANLKNVLEVKSEYTKNDNDKFSYAISVDLVEIIKELEDVVSNVPIIKDINTLKSFFRSSHNNPGVNDEISSSEKVNLIDCFTRCKRIATPARSVNCTHLSVFDLKYFLAMNRKSKAYDCPLCRKKSTRLYVDGFLHKIMAENKNIEEIVLSQDYEMDQKGNFNNVNNTIVKINQNNINGCFDSIINRDREKEQIVYLDSPDKTQRESNSNGISTTINHVDEDLNSNNIITNTNTNMNTPDPEINFNNELQKNLLPQKFSAQNKSSNEKFKVVRGNRNKNVPPDNYSNLDKILNVMNSQNNYIISEQIISTNINGSISNNINQEENQTVNTNTSIDLVILENDLRPILSPKNDKNNCSILDKKLYENLYNKEKKNLRFGKFFDYLVKKIRHPEES